MRPYLFAFTVAAAIGACDLSPSNPLPPTLRLSPILDSLFVGDSLPARTVTLYDENGNIANPGTITWTINPTAVATINGTSGLIHGVGKGAAIIKARDAAGDSALALVVVSSRLDLTLLMDTVFLLPGDTFTIPLAIKKKDPLADSTVWFDPSPNAGVYTIDTATGLVSATNPGGGGPIKYFAHVATSTDTVSETGAVVALVIGSTAGGRFYATIIGTAIRHEGGAAYAMNYARTNGRLAFRLTDSLLAPDTSRYERIMFTRPDSIIDTVTAAIDSMNPQEASVSIGTLDVICNPPRPWALWSSILPRPQIHAYSHIVGAHAHAGTLTITKYVPVVPSGAVIGGRFLFTAQRTDLYYDTLGVETIRGTFVAPLGLDNTRCQS